MSEVMIGTWAPDDFWHAAQPLIPIPAPRRQGGGKRRADDRAILAAIVYLVQAGRSWRKLPTVLFGVSRATVRRRFTQWTASGLWERLHHVFLTRLNAISEIDWSRAMGGLDRGPRREGGRYRANPVDCGKPGSKIHVMYDRTGPPLTVLISAANVHDSGLMVPLLDSFALARGTGRQTARG